ncbi:MAG: Trp family transcriptional regulator, partial [bacterium]|nr:Trp family transcriptional regulator [bacterium]
MRISQKNINKHLQQEILGIFFQLISDTQNPEEAKMIFESLLSPAEAEAIAKRLSVAHYLDKNRSYQNIKDNLGVSSATIAVIDKARKSAGYRLALKKIEADRWAGKWAEK